MPTGWLPYLFCYWEVMAWDEVCSTYQLPVTAPCVAGGRTSIVMHLIVMLSPPPLPGYKQHTHFYDARFALCTFTFVVSFGESCDRLNYSATDLGLQRLNSVKWDKTTMINKGRGNISSEIILSYFKVQPRPSLGRTQQFAAEQSISWPVPNKHFSNKYMLVIIIFSCNTD